jgi:hypothetical protein
VRLPEPVADLLRTQRDLATVGQLQALGLSRAAVRWRLENGWHLVLPRVVHAGPGRLDDVQRMIAAALFAGQGAVVVSSAAARYHGVTAAADARIRVEVPAARNPRSTGPVVVRRTGRPDTHAWRRNGILIASPARAVIGAALDARRDEVTRAIVIEAVQRRICTVSSLRHELESGPRAGSAAVRAALAEAEAGAWSPPEADLLTILGTSRVLPPAWANPQLFAPDGTTLPRPDAWLDDVALAVQVHSWTHHGDAANWDRTVAADGVYAEHGIIVVAVTPALVRQDPVAVLRRIERCYAAARLRARPAVTARLDAERR